MSDAKIPPLSGKLQKRLRHRRGYVKELGHHDQWDEWQVVEGRRVIGRFDLEKQADDLIVQRTGRKP